MSEASILPYRMTVLGEALRLVWMRLEAELKRPAIPTVPAGTLESLASDYLDRLSQAIGRLSDRIDGLMKKVVANETARENDVYLSVGQLEAIVEDILLDSMTTVSELPAPGQLPKRRRRLIGNLQSGGKISATGTTTLTPASSATSSPSVTSWSCR